MKAPALHQPGTPRTTDPPPRLLELADTLDGPQVLQLGITTTADGQWALYVIVPADAEVPVARIEAQAEGFPVVYEAAPAAPPYAGPAYPGRGE